MVTRVHTVSTQLVVSAAETYIHLQTTPTQEIFLPNALYAQVTIQPTTEDTTSIENSNAERSLTTKVTFYTIMLILNHLIIVSL